MDVFWMTVRFDKRNFIFFAWWWYYVWPWVRIALKSYEEWFEISLLSPGNVPRQQSRRCWTAESGTEQILQRSPVLVRWKLRMREDESIVGHAPLSKFWREKAEALASAYTSRGSFFIYISLSFSREVLMMIFLFKKSVTTFIFIVTTTTSTDQ